MTRKEIIDGLRFTIDMFLFNPDTGETYTEPRNDMDKTTIDACKGAIELLEERPKGKWIEAIDTGTEMLECSVCECRVKKKSYAESVGTDGYNYCPYCGADMRKETKKGETHD